MNLNHVVVAVVVVVVVGLRERERERESCVSLDVNIGSHYLPLFLYESPQPHKGWDGASFSSPK